MRKALVVLVSMLPSLSMANGFYIGITGPGFTRGGFLFGYQFNNVQSIELAIYPDPGVAGSISLASKTYIDHEDHYVVAGYSGRNVNNRQERGPFMAFGKEFFIDEYNGWSAPIELGGGIGRRGSDGSWSFMGVYSFGILYGVSRYE